MLDTNMFAPNTDCINITHKAKKLTYNNMHCYVIYYIEYLK